MLRELNLKARWREHEAVESDNEDADGYSVSSGTGGSSDYGSADDSDWDCALDDEKRKPLGPIKAVSLARWPIIAPHMYVVLFPASA